jgi:hypothetical protein
MNVKIIEVQVDRIGRRYPVGHQLSDAEWRRAVTIAHTLRCRDGLSYRQVQRSLLAFGIRRSLGQVYADAKRPTCPHCPDKSPDPVPDPQERPAAAVHQRPGGLTGQVPRG